MGLARIFEFSKFTRIWEVFLYAIYFTWFLIHNRHLKLLNVILAAIEYFATFVKKCREKESKEEIKKVNR